MNNPTLPRANSKNSTNVRNKKLPLGLRFLQVANPLLATVSGELAAIWAARQFTTPMKLKHNKYNRDVLLTADAFRIPHHDGHLAVWSWGKGPTVILAHGWSGRGSQLARFVSPLVDAGYRVVIFDAPGHGQSSGTRSTLPEFAWALRRVAESLGPVHAVIAHSMGGAATAVALKYGMQADRVVSLGSPSDLRASSERFAAFFHIPPEVRGKMQARLEKKFGLRWDAISGAAIGPAMRVPALIVHDRDDAEVPYAEAVALADAWPGAKLITTSRLGHHKLLRDNVIIDTAVRFVTANDEKPADSPDEFLRLSSPISDGPVFSYDNSGNHTDQNVLLHGRVLRRLEEQPSR